MSDPDPEAQSEPEITQLLRAWAQGNGDALQEMVPLVLYYRFSERASRDPFWTGRTRKRQNQPSSALTAYFLTSLLGRLLAHGVSRGARTTQKCAPQLTGL